MRHCHTFEPLLIKLWICVLNSQQLGIAEWRQKLDSQRGAVLATELKNNSFKLAKWTVCALLSSSDHIKFG